MITAPLNVELPALPRSDQQSLKGSRPDLVNKPIRGSLYYDTSFLTKIRSPHHNKGYLPWFCDPPMSAKNRKEGQTLNRYFTHSSTPKIC